MTHILRDASILITGGTGAFGRAFVRHALLAGARRVAVFSRDEAKHAAMQSLYPNPRVRHFVGDVRDSDRVQWAMRGVDMVIHAAAMKRIDHCEADPQEAIQTNILGSQNVALAAIQCRVPRAVLLSTDKAASACTLYGMTKAVAERSWIQSNAYADGTGTRLSATRYGNVLGSTGSVVPIWQAAKRAGEALHITSLDATRFWMTMNDAVWLVTVALTDMTGGETFVPKAGAAPVVDVASAITPMWRHKYLCTGLRAGEKLHETLISADEAERTIDVGGYYVIRPAHQTWDDTFTQAYSHVPANFSLRSDTTDHRLDMDALTRMVNT